MATPAQVASNRLNAQKSTGPRTPGGKAPSKFNTLKHSLDAQPIVLPGEDPDAYQALVAAYHGEWDPTTHAEIFHVKTMIRADWTCKRLRRTEAQLQRTLLAESHGDFAASLLSDTPPPRRSPASSVSSPPSNAPGTAPTTTSAASTAIRATSKPRPSKTGSTANAPPSIANWLRSHHPVGQASRLPSRAKLASFLLHFATDIVACSPRKPPSFAKSVPAKHHQCLCSLCERTAGIQQNPLLQKPLSA